MEELDDYGSRRPRSRNWNTAEKFFLFEHVKNRFDIITDPRKETASINAKRKVWEQIYQAIAKEFGPLEEHLVRGKGGEKCRSQWKNLVQAARKEYKQYMEAKMVGKRHNMTLLSRKICRLMSIDLDDGVGEQDNEENDWTEDHPEFRYQPELCQELKEAARRINEEYAQGLYDALPDSNPGDYEDLGDYEDDENIDSEVEINDDEKDEDYAPSKRSGSGRKRRRASSGKAASKTTPTRTSARAQAAQAKKAEEKKQAAKRQKAAQEELMHSDYQVGSLSEHTQQEILNLHVAEHKKRMTLMNAEHKSKMNNLKLEGEVIALQKEFWARKLEGLQNRGKGGKDEDDVEDEVNFVDEEGAIADDQEGDEMETNQPGSSSDPVSAPPIPASPAEPAASPKSDPPPPPPSALEPVVPGVQAAPPPPDTPNIDTPDIPQDAPPNSSMPDSSRETAMETPPSEDIAIAPTQDVAERPSPINEIPQ